MDGHMLRFILHHPYITLHAMFILVHLAPRLVTVHDWVILHSNGFQHEKQLIQIFLTFPQLVVQHISRNRHVRIRKPLVQQAKRDVLHIALIGDSLQELRHRLCNLKTGHNFRMTVTWRIISFRLLLKYDVMDHFKTFLHKTDSQAEHLDRLALYHTTRKPNPRNTRQTPRLPPPSYTNQYG